MSDVQVVTKIHIRYMSLSDFVERVKEWASTMPTDTKLCGIANLTIYYDQKEGGAE